MNKAVFLDRDGVLNKPVFNPDTGEYESPHHPDDLHLFEWTIESLKKINTDGYLMFVVSNQPSYAKGKTSMENIKKIHEKLESELEKHGVFIKEFYYCYHHPHGIVKEYSYECECRKPKPYFLMKAKKDYGIDMKISWMIGDRDTDIFCGQNAGVKTILIEEASSYNNRGKSKPDFYAENLKDAVNIITGSKI
jgi:D-glycero-D-manno-heptose 1,7-bisphosphate phosphatase